MRQSNPGFRVAAWLALGCHVLVAGGLPLPLATPRDRPAARGAKDRSRPFPCMDKPCGCATAEQCFADCCCHTPAERLAWARAHDVEPDVLAALERRTAVATEPAAGCCATRAETPSCCAAAGAAPAAAGPDACCLDACSDDRPQAPAPVEDDADASETASRCVILRDMLACGGIVTAWLACGAALPPPPRIQPPAHDAAVGGVSVRDDVAVSISAEPPAPPPRAA